MIRIELTEAESMAACCAIDRYRYEHPLIDSKLRALWHRFVKAGCAISMRSRTAGFLSVILSIAVNLRWEDSETPKNCARLLAKLEGAR